MSGAMNRHCIPGLTMSTALTGNFSAGVSGQLSKILQVALRIYVCYWCSGRTDVRLAWKDLCSVLNALSK